MSKSIKTEIFQNTGHPSVALRFEMDDFMRDLDRLERYLVTDNQIIRVIRQVARKIKKEATQTYKTKWKKANSKEHGDPIVRGLVDWQKKYRKTGNKYILLSTFGNRKKGSRSYFLSFFEGGTQERKKGDRSYGRIKPIGAFTDALKANESEFEQAVKEAIDKIIKKK